VVEVELEDEDDPEEDVEVVDSLIGPVEVVELLDGDGPEEGVVVVVVPPLRGCVGITNVPLGVEEDDAADLGVVLWW